MFMKPAVLFAALASLTLATPVASAEKSYTYQGDRSAKKICRAIVRDKPKQLRIHLMRAAQFNAIPYRTIHNEYACNDLASIDFAYEVEAVHTITYLKSRGAVRTRVTMEELAAL